MVGLTGVVPHHMVAQPHLLAYIPTYVTQPGQCWHPHPHLAPLTNFTSGQEGAQDSRGSSTQMARVPVGQLSWAVLGPPQTLLPLQPSAP